MPRATSARTSKAPASTSTSRCTPVPAPTSVVRRRRCSTAWRAVAASRGSSRRSRPWPASTPGPTVVNNVESIASVPPILLHGADWFAAMGTEKLQGLRHLQPVRARHPAGQYEAPLGITLRELLDMAGGIRGGKKLKFWTPGGSPRRCSPAEHLDVPLDFESVAKAGSMLGTRALQIFDETVSVVRAVDRWIDFYKHESCGKCTPCREGTWWLRQILRRLEHGQGDEETSRSCSTSATTSSGAVVLRARRRRDLARSPGIKYFREEFET
jgi:NADH-quinone oxidoreductase subunit F